MPAIILYCPEIPPNTGNIIRLAANCGFSLHLIKPLGFSLSEHALRRSAMDYREIASLEVHDSLDACLQQLKRPRLVLVSTRARVSYHQFSFETNSALLFGNESNGLPPSVWHEHSDKPCITIPMRPNNRSINLSNAVAIISWYCWQQLGFSGANLQTNL